MRKKGKYERRKDEKMGERKELTALINRRKRNRIQRKGITIINEKKKEKQKQKI